MKIIVTKKSVFILFILNRFKKVNKIFIDHKISAFIDNSLQTLNDNNFFWRVSLFYFKLCYFWPQFIEILIL